MPLILPVPLSGFAALQSHWRNRASFTLLDLDFDEGRRLLAVAAALFDDPAGPDRLHYVALAEHWQGTAAAARAVVAASADAGAPLALFAAELMRAWLPPVPGFQRLVLAQGRVVLTLAAGPPAANLPQLELAFDLACCRRSAASPNAIRWLGRLAAEEALLILGGPAGDATAAAAAAAAMRADFTQAGFAEDPRFPDGGADAADLLRRVPHPNLQPGSQTNLRPPSPRSASRRISTAPPQTEKHAIVIGAGLAGAAACHRLAVRGWRCTLIEQHPAAAQEASGNAAGIFMPVLSRDDNPLSRLSRAAFLFALHVWDGLGGVGAALPGQACGVLQLPRSDAAEGAAGYSEGYSEGHNERNSEPDAAWPPDFARRVSSAEASAALGQRVGGGWWFPAAGWLRPSAVCEAMLRACGARLQILYERQAARLMEDGGVWRVLDAAGAAIAQAPVVILANGVDATRLAQATALPLRAIRGQVTHLPAECADVPFVVCGDAYLTPAAAVTAAEGASQPGQGMASLGATYEDDADPALRLQSHRQNLAHLGQMLPDWMPPRDVAALDGRVGFRCVSADRLPLAGALPDPAQRHGSGDVRLEDMPRLAGLHGLLGYGSRGLIWAPLAAELLAARLNGEPSPLPRNLAALLDPARFALKQRRRG